MPTANVIIEKSDYALLGGKIPVGEMVLFFPEGEKKSLKNGAVITEIKKPLSPKIFKELTSREEGHILFLASIAKTSFTHYDCEKRDECIDVAEKWWAFSCQYCPFYEK